MSSFRIRPRFKHVVSLDQDLLETSLKEQIKESETFSSTYSPGHLIVKISPKFRHYWSPQLSLSFEKHEDDGLTGTLIRGLYGPNPTVWAIFFFGYASISVIALFAAIFGFSQVMLGQSGMVLWILPGCGIAALILYLFAQTGQKIGAQQMYDLHHFYESQIKERVEIS